MAVIELYGKLNIFESIQVPAPPYFRKSPVIKGFRFVGFDPETYGKILLGTGIIRKLVFCQSPVKQGFGMLRIILQNDVECLYGPGELLC